MRPSLSGVTCFITRPKQQSSEIVQRIAQLGGQVVNSPVIQIQRVDQDVLAPYCRRLADFDFLIATSANALSVLRAACDSLGIEIGTAPPVYVIGESSRNTAVRLGFRPLSFTGVGTGKQLVEHLVRHVPQGTSLFFPRGQLADNSLVEMLSSGGYEVHPVTVYETVPLTVQLDEWKHSLAATALGVVLFYSPSAVDSWLLQCRALIHEFQDRMRFVAIGKTTYKSLNENQLYPSIASATPTTESIVEAILTLLNRM